MTHLSKYAVYPFEGTLRVEREREREKEREREREREKKREGKTLFYMNNSVLYILKGTEKERERE